MEKNNLVDLLKGARDTLGAVVVVAAPLVVAGPVVVAVPPVVVAGWASASAMVVGVGVTRISEPRPDGAPGGSSTVEATLMVGSTSGTEAVVRWMLDKGLRLKLCDLLKGMF